MTTRKNQLETSIIPANLAEDAGRFAPVNDLARLSFWSDLSASKQNQIKEEVRQLTAARVLHTQSGLAIGKHLLNIYNTCEPYSGAFRKILNSFAFVERTAYRYIETYKNARETFSENIILAAMANGLNILSHSKDQPLGKYTEAVRLLPPPKNPDPEQAKRYVQQLEQTYRDHKKATHGQGTISEATDPNGLLKANFRSIKNALAHLPSRKRRSWFNSLVGMAMMEAGIQSPATFEPEAVPAEFRQGPGRPRIEQEEVAA